MSRPVIVIPDSSASALAHDRTRRIASERFLQYAKDEGISELDFEDFEIIEHIADGGYGSVWKAKRRGDRDSSRFFAMKFFGYGKTPNQDYIETDEIIKDWELKHLSCTSDILGYFFDSYDGLVADRVRTSDGRKTSGKRSPGCYLVKVSDYLHSDVLVALTDHKMQFSQRDASTLFRNIAKALQELHDAGVVHCDLKPENIMFVNDVRNKSDPNRLDIKLIDFGFSERLAFGETSFFSDKVRGTRHFIAPETIMDFSNKPRKFIYSKKSDIWQAAVTLFVIIFHDYPFLDPHVVMRFQGPFNIQQDKRFSGLSVSQLSDGGHDLFRQLFCRDYNERLNTRQILNHSWIRDNASLPDQDFGESYRESLKNWSHRRRFKRAIEERGYAMIKVRGKLNDILAKRGLPHPTISTVSFRNLQRSFRDHCKGPDKSIASSRNGINFDSFCQVVREHHLEQLANAEVFGTFDVDVNGTVSYFEFLFALDVFRASDTTSPEENAKFYFEVFDWNSSEDISRGEFKDVMSHLIAFDPDQAFSNISDNEMDSIFDSIDTKKLDSIDFEQFRAFFTHVNILKLGQKRSLSHDEGRETRLREDFETHGEMSIGRNFSNISSVTAASMKSARSI